MKRFLIILSAICVIFSTSCQEIISEQSKILTEQRIERNRVSIEDIQNYLTKKNAQTKAISVEVSPILSIHGDTLFYAINYTDGWELISADKRTPPIIGYSETGRFDINKGNDSFYSWINSISIDMDRIIKADDKDLSFSMQQIKRNKDVWSKTPQMIDDTSFIDLGVRGSYKYLRTETILDSYIEVPHITNTRWHQGDPYNLYCPASNHEGNHMPAGCIAVAGGQMLYNLYEQNGVPQFAFPGTSFSDLSAVPSSPLTQSDDNAAQFLSVVGYCVNMHYNDSGSWALPSNLEFLFSDYGYGYTYQNYDASTVREQLLQNKPVLVIAFQDLILSIPDITKGHAFIIDAYKLEKWITRDVYRFVPSNPRDLIPMDIYFSYRNIVESYGEMKVKMNWGWAGQWASPYYYNDGWYSMTNTWITNNPDLELSVSKTMYHSFIPLSEQSL